MQTDIQMPPLNTTLLGVVIGALEQHNQAVSHACAFGASGHAFLMNIHETLCPSSPYCWNRGPFFELLGNLGLQVEALGDYSGDSSADDRARLEQRIRTALEHGQVCSVLNMENQLIVGYDETSLLLARPWGETPMTPARLTYGSWQEFQPVHAVFFTFRRQEAAPQSKQVRDSLAYALDLYRNPSRHELHSYAVGAGAYKNWLAGLAAGYGESHGHWWNAMVWSECRNFAADYLTEAGEPELSDRYRQVAHALTASTDKGVDAKEKMRWIRQAEEIEQSCLDDLERAHRRFAAASHT